MGCKLNCLWLFCRKKLARRLLFDRSANDDHERSILTKLKQQCGGQFTSKMEGMVSLSVPMFIVSKWWLLWWFIFSIYLICWLQVTDLTLARENQNSFEEYLGNNPAANPGIDLTITVLTTGFWPSYKSFDINLPAEMVNLCWIFEYAALKENVLLPDEAKPIDLFVSGQVCWSFQRVLWNKDKT